MTVEKEDQVINSEAQWLAAVKEYNKKSSEYLMLHAMDELTQLGLLAIRKQVKYILEKKDTARDNPFILLYYKNGKRSFILVDPFKISIRMFSVYKNNPTDNLYIRLYSTMYYLRRDAKYALRKGSYDSIDLQYPAAISSEDRTALNKIRKYYGMHPELDPHIIDRQDMICMAKDLKINAKALTTHIKMFRALNSSLSIDALKNDHSDASEEAPAPQLPDPLMDGGVEEFLEHDTFPQQLELAGKVLNGKSKACKSTVRCFTTRFLTDKIVVSTPRFHVGDFTAARSRLQSASTNDRDADTIMVKEQETTGSEPFSTILVCGEKLNACCDESIMFDTLIACWLFAKGTLALKKNGTYNNESYAAILREAFQAADRGRNAPDATTLGRASMINHIEAVLSAFISPKYMAT